MTTPRRLPLRRDDLDVETTLELFRAIAPVVELGWSVLRQEMRDAGWPSRTPEGDRTPATGPHSCQSEPACIDYADPTGDRAMRFDDHLGDLEALQDHWHLAHSSLRAMTRIAGRYLPAPWHGEEPKCARCDEVVERTPAGNYRGMEKIAGMWVAKKGVRPMCARHRTEQRRHGEAA